MIEREAYTLNIPATASCLWRLTINMTGESFDIAPPAFEVDGTVHTAALEDVAPLGEPRVAFDGVTELTYAGQFASDPALSLEITFRLAEDSPIVRFRYRLASAAPRALTRTTDADRLRYLSVDAESLPQRTEVRLSEFDEAAHSYRLTEHSVPDRAFEHALTVTGPMFVAAGPAHALLIAYEHGSQVPDAFIHYALAPDAHVVMEAVKGNYYPGRRLDMAPFETIWMEVGAIPGDVNALASAYRTFVLRYLSPNTESRQPYIFYNTWNYQERNKWWNDATFLASMHQDRILEEIDIAHRMGIDVFVIDTGWYEKTGDWRVNRGRFPDGLKVIKEKLDGYSMKLGLWFSPRQAAVSSEMLQNHKDCLMAWNGKVADPRPVWETEESQQLCLVSRYWEAFADELIRLNREVGVTYFKWDAIHQYGCNAAGHDHGTDDNTPEERADCYAFELPRYMSRVVDRVVAACPEAIVDFDITEGHRAVGLGFLASGKYFLINNGPYYRSLDDPDYAPGGGMGANVFVFPGPARARVCRTPIGYDKWLPAVLFLTHYLPDDPKSSQMINLASLVLGQNGIWGDLPEVSEEGVDLFGQVLAKYKVVADDVTAADPVRTGDVGGSPEVHEKISAVSGRGLVALFAAAPGRYTYVTQYPVAQPYWASDGVRVSLDAQGRAELEVDIAAAGAGLVFFGVDTA